MYQQHQDGGVEEERPEVPWVGEGRDQWDRTKRPITAQGGRGEQEPSVHDIDVAEAHDPGEWGGGEGGGGGGGGGREGGSSHSVKFWCCGLGILQSF